MLRLVHHASALDLLKTLDDSSVDLIYIDPPFGTGRVQSARSGEYADPSAEYVSFLEPHVREAHRVLKHTGSFCVHVDWHQSHRARTVCDQVFGDGALLNEIIWAYDFGGRGKDRWPRKHDNILVYAKEPGKHVFNWEEIERIPYMAPGLQKDPERAARGKVPTDVWWMSIVGTSSKERTGYPTQKPIALVERFIVALSPPDGIVLDFFAGSGTTAVAAVKHGRQFIVGDSSEDAQSIIKQRLVDVPGVTYQR